MTATKIFMGTIFVENFMQNIFFNLTFFSKMRILRVTGGKLTLSLRFELSAKGDNKSWEPLISPDNT